MAVAGGVSLAAVMASCVLWGPLVALGYAGGVLTGAGLLSALVFVLNRLIVPHDECRGPAWPWMVLHLGKFGLVAALAYLVIIVLHGSTAAFAAGYATALVTLFIAMGGRTRVAPAALTDDAEVGR